MLFINFLCLFYLMVLINGHTISKTTDYNPEFYDIVDSVNDLDLKREYKPRHDRLRHKYRREDKKEKTKPATPVKEETKAKKKQTTTEATKHLITKEPTNKETKKSHFWNKFRHKKEKHVKKVSLHNREVPEVYRYYSRYRDLDKIYNSFDDAHDSFDRRRNYRRRKQVSKKKRDVCRITSPKTTLSTLTPKTKAKVETRSISDFDSTVASRIGSSSRNILSPLTIKTYQAATTIDNITEALTEMTTQLSSLKEEYGLTTINQSSSSLDTSSLFSNITNKLGIVPITTALPTPDFDFPGTAQIEALLNEIKINAVKMVAEQNPAITDIITNSVTETTFEADPILNHLDVRTPGYALSTFISIDIPYSKRTAYSNKTVIIANTEPTHVLAARSIKEDVYTIAHSIEDELQKQLKKVYKKVKCKMSSDLRKEVAQISSTAKKLSSKLEEKVSCTKKCTTKPMPKHFTYKPKKTSIKTRHAKLNEKLKSTRMTPASTIDDYVMLTIFEQMLAKTHQDNVMKIIATTEVPSESPSEYFKREIKSSTEKLKMNYDDTAVPDYSFSSMPSSSNYSFESTEPTYENSTESAEDTSYEGLSNKISYNDYVNGYKHYLKFQKEQGQQNFSDLVKYQAHRHHNVDDIGKFILNKIPQMPSGRLKRFFDDDNMEYQDISTKSDDSWFKKHFYFFIDNGPPKKFHTSQTVALKSPISYSESSIGYMTSSKARSSSKSLLITDKQTMAEMREDYVEGETREINLEELSRTLSDRMSSTGFQLMDETTAPTNFEIGDIEPEPTESAGPLQFVEKLFNEKKYNSKKTTEKLKGNAVETNTHSGIFNIALDRGKRNDKVFENSENYDDAIKPTLQGNIDPKNKNYGYVDVNLIPRPTAIVKLRDNKKKTSKIKTFFSKFHFRKHKKQHQKTKRESRNQRFNPLKTLRNMFKYKKGNPKSVTEADLPDYELLTSRIDTFKPVKFDKIMSLDEIHKQIPNITADFPLETSVEKPKLFNKPSHHEFNNPLLSGNQFSFDISTEFSSKFTDYYPYARESKKTPRSRTTTKFPISTQSETSKFLDDLYNSVMSEDKEFESPDYLATTTVSRNATHTTNVDEIKTELQNMDMNITRQSERTKATSISTRMSRIPYQKMYIPPYLQGVTSERPKVAKNTARQSIDENTVKDSIVRDFKIHSKLTRIAKFPLSHIPKNKATPGVEDSDSNILQELEGNLSNKMEFKREVRSRRPYVTKSVEAKRSDESNFNEFTKRHNYKPFPDYFNDLLMWHSDILNADKVTTQAWDSLSTENPGATVPNKIDMENELNKINDFIGLNENFVVKPNKAKPLKNKKDQHDKHKEPSVVRTIALVDDAIAKSDNMLIKGKAKYLQLYNEPNIEDKYSKTAVLVNDLSKIYFKSPSIKYNIDHRLREGKRHGDFWKNSFDVKKNSDSSSVMFLDSTVLSYDDGPHFLVESPKQKKFFKTPVWNRDATKTKASSKPVSQMNQSPEQYFTTPLPMKKEEFNKFLQEHEIDVQSVTKPLKDLPKLVDVYKNKESRLKGDKNKALIKTTAEILSNTTVTTDLKHRLMKNSKAKAAMKGVTSAVKATQKIYSFNYDDSPDSYDDMEDLRPKRFSQLTETVSDNSNQDQTSAKKSKNHIFKKKIKLFEKKYNTMIPTLADMTYSIATTRDNLDTDVELTIINMDEINDKIQPKFYHNSDIRNKPEAKAKEQSKKTKVNKTKTKPSKEIVFNAPKAAANPLSVSKAESKDTNKNLEKSNKDLRQYIFIATESDNSVESPLKPYSLVTATPLQQLIGNDFLNKLHAKSNQPKRVRIISHDCKYDIVYKDRLNEKRNLPRFTSIKPVGLNTLNRVELFHSNRHQRSRGKRRLKLFSHIKNKLIVLMGKSQKKSTTSVVEAKKATNETTNATSTRPKAKPEDVKSGALVPDEIPLNYDFDIDKFDVGQGKNCDVSTKDTLRKRNLTSTEVFVEHSVVGNARNNSDPTEKVDAQIPAINSTKAELKLGKRDLSTLEKFTAKDVAAIEVIVDLVRNTLGVDEEYLTRPENVARLATTTNHSTTTSRLAYGTSPTPTPFSATNAIQVHIAIPYNLSFSKKRSVSSKLRKVFAAKMLKPVDVEYQVHSYVNPRDAPSTPAMVLEFKPGATLYFLVDSTGADTTKSDENYPINPYRHITYIKSRQAETTQAYDLKSDTTVASNMSKITLSKDFIEVVNKHLIQLYENLTAINDTTEKHHVKARKTDQYESSGRRRMRLYRRHINWDVVKKFFSHDRGHNCKCRANHTMCRACAASDAVISELIYEFDNLANYMKDHCAEIQTYFSLNPSGGKRLRDSVHRVDQTMHKYYKRVKGNCQSRTCKTYTPCIDKRSFIKQRRFPKKYVGEPLIQDLQKLAEDIALASVYNMSCDNSLIDKEEALMDSVKNCIRAAPARTMARPHHSPPKKPVLNNVYSLDKINVNIICNPEQSTESLVQLTVPMTKNLWADDYDYVTRKPPDYMSEFLREANKLTGFKKFFSGHTGMNSLFTYYTTQFDDYKPNKSNHKRQVVVDSPLVADTGGTFWQDYMKGKESKVSVTTELKNKESVTHSLTPTPTFSFDNESQYTATTENQPLTEKHMQQRDANSTENSIETISNNINELFKLFHNLTDLDEMDFLRTEPHKTKPNSTTAKNPTHAKTKTHKSLKNKFHFKHKPKSAHKQNGNKKPASNSTLGNNGEPVSGIPNSVETTTNALVSPKYSFMEPTVTVKTLKDSKNMPVSSDYGKAVSDDPFSAFEPNKNSIKTSVKVTSMKNSQSSSMKEGVPMKDLSTVKESLPLKDVPSPSMKETENIPINVGKTKSKSFFDRLKSATFDFFHGKDKSNNKTEPRSHRLSVTEPTVFRTLEYVTPGTKLAENLDILNITKPPTILIINDYEDDNASDDDLEDTETPFTSDSQRNFKSLLLSILDYEKGRLNSEWNRFKKDKTTTLHHEQGTSETPESFREWLTNQRTAMSSTVKWTNAPTKTDVNYDIMKKKFGELDADTTANSGTKSSLKSTKIPANTRKISELKEGYKGGEHVKVGEEKKEGGLIQKIVSRLGMKAATATHKKGVNAPTQSSESATEINDTNPNCRLCDIEATFKHIAKLKKQIPKRDFEKLVSNVTCYKLKSLPRYFIIRYKKKLNIKERYMRVTRERDLKFDWIRQRRAVTEEQFKNSHEIDIIRSINSKIYDDKHFYENKLIIDDDDDSLCSGFRRKKRQEAKTDDKNANSKKCHLSVAIFHKSDKTYPYPDLNNVNNKQNNAIDSNDNQRHTEVKTEKSLKTQTSNDLIELFQKVHKKHCDVQMKFVTGNEDFETFEKGQFGIYRRRKRSLDDVADLSTNIQNWPLQPNPKETYTMLGDSVILQCSVDNTKETNTTAWSTSRRDMLIYENVVLDGSRVYIKAVGAMNQGEYVCKRGHHIPKSLNVTVITLPTFDIVFAPVYSVDKECTYEDLRTIQPIQAILSRECCPHNQICTVSVEDPICLSDRLDGTSNLRMTLVLSVAPRKGVRCSPRCRRNLLASIALLVARNAPALASVPVLISNEYFNKTLTPLMPRNARRLIITHTLRKKDSRSKRHVISNPDGVNIYMVCPAGYYLLSEQRICAACPSGCWSKAGDNVCRVCPRGTHSIPGEDSCHRLVKRVRRFDCAGCGWWAACAGGAGGAALALACAAAARAARAPAPAAARTRDVPKVQCRARPLSPSRVILAKFFRGSPSSTRATGSQETKFGLWKERNNPPPLPPIDFDL